MSRIPPSTLLMFIPWITFVLLFFGGVGITAYAAGNSLPGDALFPFKTTIEKARVKLADDSVAQASLHVQFAGQRILEMQSLIDRGRHADIALASDEFANNIQQALGVTQGLSQTDPAQASALNVEILVVLRRYDEILNQNLANLHQDSPLVIHSVINDVQSPAGNNNENNDDDDDSSNLLPASTSTILPTVLATDMPIRSPTSTAIIIILSTSTPFSLPVNSPTSPVIEGGDVTCQGLLGAVTVDNLYVPQGSTCALHGTMIRGTIKVETGASLTVRQITVFGNIQAEGANYIEVIAGSSVGGSIQIKHSGAARVEDASVSGDIQFESNAGALSIARNHVIGNVQVFKNAGGVNTSNNVINGNLQCKENDPVPAGGNNAVRGNKEDQCAGL